MYCDNSTAISSHFKQMYAVNLTKLHFREPSGYSSASFQRSSGATGKRGENWLQPATTLPPTTFSVKRLMMMRFKVDFSGWVYTEG